MVEIQTKLSEIIEGLAVQTIMVEADDVMRLGIILEQLEEIEKISLDHGFLPIGSLSGSLKKVVEKIILKELSNPQEGIELLGEGVKIIQSRISHPEPYPSSGEELFWKKFESITGEKKSIAPLRENEISGRNPTEITPSPLNQEVDLYMDFISEALEHLGTIELKIINLEQSPDDKECINSIFRPFHTLKGVSGFLNLHGINQFSHAMESLLDKVRTDQLQVNEEMIDFILEAVDLLKNMIFDVKAHVDSGEPGQSPVDLQHYFDRIALLERGNISGQRTSGKGSVPPGETDVAKPPLGEILSNRGIISEEDISQALSEQMKGKGHLKLGEILIKEKKARPKQVVDALREQKQITDQLSETTVKVDTKKLDNLVDMVGELVIAHSLVEQNPVFSSIHDQKLPRDFSQLKRITSDLQKISMSLRMVPIRQTFQKMVRLVRDVAKKSEKLVDLMMSGEETEIDRNMVDSLYDPLVHMIRNAIDHGIEVPARRKEIGKAEMGKVFLRAYQKGGNVVVEIEDDGQGLNREKILKKARERGLISDETQLSEYQIDNLIFEPGFSTADQVTDVSGRGVGMDVVKKTIEKLKGNVEIISKEGRGSRFMLRVPLTLAIMDGIIVRTGEERYIIPTVFIKETVRPRREDIFTVQKRGELIKVRDNLLPLIRLHRLFGIVPRKEEPWETLVVVVENEGYQKGIMVDDLVGKQEVVIKNLGERLKDVRGVAGATVMGDGRVGLILDIHGIFQIDQGLN